MIERASSRIHEDPVANDDRHMAMPKLYGAPAYARPPMPVAQSERPLSPDDLPLEAEQTAEEREYLEGVVARSFASVTGEQVAVGAGGGREGSPMLRGRPFRLGSITSRLRGDGGSTRDS